VKVRLGLPIGSLQEATLNLMERAGFKFYVERRSYFPLGDDEELEARLIRPQDMPRFVERGVVDAGLTGRDWVLENRADVKVVAELVYAKQRLTPVRWVVAVPIDSDIRTPADLEGKRIATELVQVTRDYLSQRGIHAEVEFSHGATEAKAPDLVDAVVDVTETGASLRAARLRIVDTVLESCTQLIANHNSWKDPAKRAKLEALAMLLQGAIAASTKVGLKMNVPPGCLEAVLARLPAMRMPTVSPLANNAGYAVETIVDESVVRAIIPELKRTGAEGIVEYPLNKVIP